MRRNVVVGILLLAILLGILSMGYGYENSKVRISTLGGSIEVKLKAPLPEKPERIPCYGITDVDKTLYASKELMKPVNNLPSREEVERIAGKYMAENGGTPDGIVLKTIETVKLKGVNVKTGKVVAEKPISVSMIYGREINGLPVVGPKADTIAISVGKGGVNYFSKLWRKIEYAGEVDIVTSKIAFEKLKKGEIMNRPMETAKLLEIFDIKPGYYASSEEQKFYVPVWIFYCVDEHGNKLGLAVNATV